MKIKPIKTRIFHEDEDLTEFILRYVKSLGEESILVVTSKIVALSEGRTVECQDEKEKIRLIKAESEFALKSKYTWFTIKDSMVMASAGLDASNANGKIILLPRDSFESAQIVRDALRKKFGIKKLGVLITDSRIFPLRRGVSGVALGYAGFKGLNDYVGKKDIFGRVFKIASTNIPDCLSSASVLCMGEGKEQMPLAVITDAPVVFTNKVNKKELYIDPREDLYGPLFSNIKKVKIKKRR
jgi:dihydrofolate synthase / folylpolyglutamate synthase